MNFFDKLKLNQNIILVKIVKTFMKILKELLIRSKKKFLFINLNLNKNLKGSMQVLLSCQEKKMKIEFYLHLQEQMKIE